MISSLKLSLLAGAVLPTAFGMGGVSNAKTSAYETIRAYVDSYAPKQQDMCSGTNCCTIGSSEACPLTAMPKDTTTMVMPGGETRCIYSYSTPFAFQVKRLPNFRDR